MNLYPPDAQPPQAFRQELRGLGCVEGQKLVIEWRYQLGRSDRLGVTPRNQASQAPVPGGTSREIEGLKGFLGEVWVTATGF